MKINFIVRSYIFDILVTTSGITMSCIFNVSAANDKTKGILIVDIDFIVEFIKSTFLLYSTECGVWEKLIKEINNKGLVGVILTNDLFWKWDMGTKLDFFNGLIEEKMYRFSGGDVLVIFKEILKKLDEECLNSLDNFFLEYFLIFIKSIYNKNHKEKFTRLIKILTEKLAKTNHIVDQMLSNIFCFLCNIKTFFKDNGVTFIVYEPLLNKLGKERKKQILTRQITNTDLYLHIC